MSGISPGMESGSGGLGLGLMSLGHGGPACASVGQEGKATDHWVLTVPATLCLTAGSVGTTAGSEIAARFPERLASSRKIIRAPVDPSCKELQVHGSLNPDRHPLRPE